MANTPITMTKIRRVFQLTQSGESQRSIATKIGISRDTVNAYLMSYAESNFSLEHLLAMDDIELSQLVYSSSIAKSESPRLTTLKNLIPHYNTELRRVGVTRKLLWLEYQLEHPDGYSYTQFCEHFTSINKQNKATMHFEHEPAEFLQIDFAGSQLSYVDTQTGEIVQCPVLVCTLPFSKYTFIEAMSSMVQESMFATLNRCLEFFGGVTRNILSDNMKQYVKKNERYEFTFQQLAEQWSAHYNANLDATRPGKPKDKPTVENHVVNIYNSVYGRLRDKTFHSLYDLNEAIKPLLKIFNSTKFQKLDGSREEIFINYEKHLLNPLPSQHFVVKHTTKGKVQLNYHVQLGEDKHYYSVPYQHIGMDTKIIYDNENVEIYLGVERIATHKRSFRPYNYTSLEIHMPSAHAYYQKMRGWDAEYFKNIGAKCGDNGLKVFEYVLNSRTFVEQAYKSCQGLKVLSETYTPERFENACKRALRGEKVNYSIVKNILERKLDMQPDHQLALDFIPDHDNKRGAKAFEK